MNKAVICIGIVLLLGGTVYAQSGGQHPGSQFPGYPGAPVQNYYQPVRVRGPEGTKIAFSIDGKFVERKSEPAAVGLLVGGDYRMRITNIPLHAGKEVFPSVKIIARTFPPAGKELEFPILIELTQEDLEAAMDGKFVTRVIYLEDSKAAMPIRGDLGTQTTTEVVGGIDPIDVAATLGQPVAIIRLGGRIPDRHSHAAFFFGCPPWAAFDKTPSERYEISLFQNTKTGPAVRRPSPAPMISAPMSPVESGMPAPVLIGQPPSLPIQ